MSKLLEGSYIGDYMGRIIGLVLRGILNPKS